MMQNKGIDDLITTHFDDISAGSRQRRNRDGVVVNEQPHLLIDAATFHNVRRLAQIRVDNLDQCSNFDISDIGYFAYRIFHLSVTHGGILSFNGIRLLLYIVNTTKICDQWSFHLNTFHTCSGIFIFVH